jgi:hypothetical protein
MANTDRPHGFNVWDKLLRANVYAVATAPVINVCPGDIVLSENTSVACTKGRGQMLSIYDAAIPPATTGDANPVLGAVLSCFDENMNPVQYIAATEVGDGTVAGYVLVADHPDQLFEAQEDGDTAAIEAADIGLNFEITSVALCAPNSATGISTQEIDSDSHNTTNTIPLRVIKMAYPLQDTIGSAGCRWVVAINPECHFYGAGTAIS